MLESLGYAAAYSGIGLLLLGVGFVVMDLLTPGKLLDQIWEKQSVNAAVVTASACIGQGGIIFTTIWAHAGAGFGDALAWTVTFGLLGIVLQTLAFLLLDLVTPGKLGELVCKSTFHPSSIVTAATQLAVSLIVIASIA
jgi:uncharacterized membrane protein YjfL (UPF0719 family)